MHHKLNHFILIVPSSHASIQLANVQNVKKFFPEAILIPLPHAKLLFLFFFITHWKKVFKEVVCGMVQSERGREDNKKHITNIVSGELLLHLAALVSILSSIWFVFRIILRLLSFACADKRNNNVEEKSVNNNILVSFFVIRLGNTCKDRIRGMN